jgi:sugar phosphate isomerase/epimerase
MIETSPQCITLAFSADHPDSRARLSWVGTNAYAVEYSPDPERLDLLPEAVSPFLKTDIPVRFHARYFRYEIGHADRHEADRALEIHKNTLKTIHDLGQSVITVHTGLGLDVPVTEERIVENLSRLVELAGRLGITVCLENLRRGHASDPRKIIEWTNLSGAMVTLDTGHAMGCPMVLNRRMSAHRIAELFASRIFQVHIYGHEDHAGHHPILNIDPLKPLINSLLHTECRWWTIELHDPDQAMSTRDIIEDYLKALDAPCAVSSGLNNPEHQWLEKYGRI